LLKIKAVRETRGPLMYHAGGACTGERYHVITHTRRWRHASLWFEFHLQLARLLIYKEVAN